MPGDKWAQYAASSQPSEKWAQYAAAADSLPSAASPIVPPAISKPRVNMQPAKEPAFGHIQTTLGDMANDTAKNLWQISAPGIATSFANQHPNVAKYLPFAMRRDAAPAKE